MPIRPARWADTGIMASVLAASFEQDRLFDVLFPHKDQYPDDYVASFRGNFRIAWWDYSKVLMVSYEKVASATVDTKHKHLLTTRNGQEEMITGVAEWERVGYGWESVWNVWGWFDPRNLIQKIVRLRYRVGYILRPCRASAQATKDDPEPLVFSNFIARIMPFSIHLLSNPLMPWRANHWSLELLGIHPSFQGKGYGKLLAQWGLARAKCDTASGVTGLPAVVISAEDKENFYQKIGFKELVGWSNRSIEGVPGVNPLEERAVGGGAVLWTWVGEDEEAAKKKADESKKL